VTHSAAASRWDVGYGHDFDGQDDDVLVQDLVVLDVRTHRQGVVACPRFPAHQAPAHATQHRISRHRA
jgi:hypothetical protein